MNKLTFAGHETFQCRNFWLKKGYDLMVSEDDFGNEEAILQLGVGKNMVSSIHFWLKAFHIKDSTGRPTELADRIFGVEGFDPYLEDEASLWLLQYFLLKTEFASIFSLVFQNFRKSRIASQYTFGQLLKYLQKEAEKGGMNVAETTLRNDIKVFTKTYLAESKHGKGMEDDLSSILIELNLISKIEDSYTEGAVYRINVSERREIPAAVILFCLLDAFEGEESVSFDSIQERVADLFACNAEGLETHIELLCEKYSFVVYKEDAGRKEVQIKGSPGKWAILEEYYNG